MDSSCVEYVLADKKFIPRKIYSFSIKDTIEMAEMDTLEILDEEN